MVCAASIAFSGTLVASAALRPTVLHPGFESGILQRLAFGTFRQQTVMQLSLFFPMDSRNYRTSDVDCL